MTTPPLYRQLFEQLSQWIEPKDRRHLQVFAEILGAMLCSQSACMHKWLPFLGHRGCEGRSHLERLSYFLRNPAITAEIFYAPLLQHLLQGWVGESMTLVLDTSMQWDEFCLIQVCLAWGGRSIPIAHRVIEHGSATVGFEQYLPVLEAAQAQLPADVAVRFLADRGFEHGELIRWLTRAQWDWAIRAKSDLLITASSGQVTCSVADLLPLSGMVHLYSEVEILGNIQCHLATGDWPEAKESWAVLTNRALSVDIFALYGQRFGGVEPYFKDNKSAAFDLKQSRLRDADALSCLFMLLSTAQLLCIVLGFWVEYHQHRSKIDAHTRRGLSFLQLGLRQIQALGHLQQPLPKFTPLPYGNPPPAYASKVKAACESDKIHFSKVVIFAF
jgi:hypothetical protein